MCLTLSIEELANIGVYMFEQNKLEKFIHASINEMFVLYNTCTRNSIFFYQFLLDNQIKNTKSNRKLRCLFMFPTPLPLSGGGINVTDFKGM
jgi:glycopeptide antibiotics resistance protein